MTDQEKVWNILKGVPAANTAVHIDDYDLTCPFCSGTYLHQSAVEIYFRKEDHETGIKAVILGGQYEHAHSISNNMQGNPSARRDGITIKFTCEGCENEPELTIVQHKGQTHINWKEYV